MNTQAQDLFTNFAQHSLDTPSILLNLVLAFIVGLLIAWIYRKTHKGLSYSQGFVTSIVLGTVVIAVVMMVIGDSITRAFGAFGAFSLIRFRTAVKDSKDMIYLFMVLALGMAIGTKSYVLVGVATPMILLFVYLLYRFNFGSIKKYDYIVSFHLDTAQAAQDVYKNIFNKYLKVKDLLNVNSVDHGRKLEMSFNVRFLNDGEKNQFMADMNKLEGVSTVSLISAKNDIEY